MTYVEPAGLTDVAAFLRHLGFHYEGPPRPADVELRRFRLEFLVEELRETAAALGFALYSTLEVNAGAEVNLAKALDGFVDLDYVLRGTVLLHGLGGVYGEAWRRVHAANLKKVPGTTCRGFAMDARKPPGWEVPNLRDLVMP